MPSRAGIYASEADSATFRAVLGHGGSERSLTGFVLPQVGRMVETADPWMPYQLVDDSGSVVEPVAAFFAELQAQATPSSTIRSYGMDLLRWWRFLAVWEIRRDRVERVDARDFMRWMAIADKPVRVHWTSSPTWMPNKPAATPPWTSASRTSPTSPAGTAAHPCSREALHYRCVRSPSRMSASMWGARSTGLDAARHNAPVSWRKSPGAASTRMLPSFLPASRSSVIAAMTGP